MIAGDTVTKTIYLQTLSGRGLSYANKAAFQADGWDISWLDTSNTALTSQPTWSIAVDSGNTRGKHYVTFTVPSGVATADVTVPGWASDPGAWTTEGQAYDEDAIAGLLQTAQGVPGVQSATDGDLGDVVDGDAWQSGTLTVPLGKLTPFGYSDLSGMTISAKLKQDPTTSPVAISSSIVDASARTVKAYWDSFPAAMALDGTATNLSQTWYLDIQLKHTVSGRIITGLRYTLKVVWQRDNTT